MNEGCLVGRIVGLPGDAVEIVGGELRINGQAWDEPYIAAEYRSSASLPATTLGPSEYLVLPENRRLIAQMKDELVVPRDTDSGATASQPLAAWMVGPESGCLSRGPPAANAVTTKYATHEIHENVAVP